MLNNIDIDTRAFVVHSQSGTPVMECATHTEASNVVSWLMKNSEEDWYHIEPVQPFAVEDATLVPVAS